MHEIALKFQCSQQTLSSPPIMASTKVSAIKKTKKIYYHYDIFLILVLHSKWKNNPFKLRSSQLQQSIGNFLT